MSENVKDKVKQVLGLMGMPADESAKLIYSWEAVPHTTSHPIERCYVRIPDDHVARIADRIEELEAENAKLKAKTITKEGMSMCKHNGGSDSGSLTRLVEFKDTFGEKVWVKPELVGWMNYSSGVQPGLAKLLNIKSRVPCLVIHYVNGVMFHVLDPDKEGGEKINQALREARAITVEE